MSIEWFGMKKYLEIEQSFKIISGHSAKRFRFSSELAPREYQRGNLSFHRNIFGGTFVSEEVVSSQRSEIEGKIFRLQAKIPRLGSQRCFLVSIRIFCEVIFPWKMFLISFLYVDRKIFTFFSKIFWRSCHNCVLRVNRNILSAIICFSNKFLFNIFGHWAKHFWHFVNFFPRKCPDCLLCVLGNISRKFFPWLYSFLLFWRKNGKNSIFLSEIRNRVWQNCIPSAHMIILRKNFVENKFFILFGTSSNFFEQSGKICLARLWTRYTTCQ